MITSGELCYFATLPQTHPAYGVTKVSHGIDWIVADLAAKGLPSVDCGVSVDEIIAPGMVILGTLTASAVLVVVP